VFPLIRDTIKSTRNIKNKIFAIPADPAAIPPKPNIPAIIAITRNINVHLSIVISFRLKNVTMLINQIAFRFSVL